MTAPDAARAREGYSAWLGTCRDCGGRCHPSHPRCRDCLTRPIERLIVRRRKLRAKYKLSQSLPARKLKNPHGVPRPKWERIRARLEYYDEQIAAEAMKQAANAFARIAAST